MFIINTRPDEIATTPECKKWCIVFPASLETHLTLKKCCLAERMDFWQAFESPWLGTDECDTDECDTDECDTDECGTDECGTDECDTDKCDTDMCNTDECGTDECQAWY